MNRMKNGRIMVTEFISTVSAHDCIACWKCVEACPRNVLGKVKFFWHRHVKFVSPGLCIGCGKCAAVCPQSLFILGKKK